MKKILVLILVLLVLLLTGCSIIDKLAEKFTGCKKTDGKAGIADDLNVVVVNTAPDLMEFPSRSIGDANFKVETSKSAKMKYSADGKEQSISVTDDSGIEWTIKIPENALINEEEISITPMSSIEVNNFPGSEFHGILLKPDGLEFVKSANVIIKKAGETVEGVILSAKHDGSDIVFSPAESYDGALKAPVQHFSTLMYMPKSDRSIQKLEEIAKEQYEGALEEAEELLKKPLSVPVPPSISYECMNEEKEKQAKEYCELVCKEEEEVLSKFIAADKGLWILFADADIHDAMIKRLLNRMNVKVQKLITQYEPDPEKFMAVFSVAARVWRQSSVFMEAPSVSTFQGWAEKAREHYMNKLTKGHEYKAFGAALEFDRICTVLNGKAISYLQQIIDSMNFRVSFEGKVVDQNNAGTETWSSQGEAKDIRWGGDLRDGKYLHLCGAGEGKHVEFSTTANVTHNSTHEKDFTFSVDVFPDPCDTGKVKVEIERFGPDALTYIDCETGGEVELASMYSYMWIMLDIFSKTDSGFLVVMDMADGVAEFEGTLEGTYGTGKINYTIKLQHTPK